MRLTVVTTPPQTGFQSPDMPGFAMSCAPQSVPQTIDTAFVSRSATAADLPAIEALHDVAFGPGALTRTAYRVREGQPPISAFCRVLYKWQTLVAAIRYTPIRIGGRGSALMLGPLAVAPAFANQGYGRQLLGESLEQARHAGIEIVVLVGDLPYYARFGFVQVAPGQLQMPGPVDPSRLLVHQLQQRDGSAVLRGRVFGAA